MYGSSEQQDWARAGFQLAQKDEIIGFKYDYFGTKPIMRGAAESQETLMEEEAGPLQIPLQVRDTVIGSLDIWSENRQLSPDEVNLLTTISGRISQTLESAQLFEQTQARAAREETINRLTASLAHSLDIDGVLQETVLQLGQLPTVVEASILVGGQSLARAPRQAQDASEAEIDPKPDPTPPDSSHPESEAPNATSPTVPPNPAFPETPPPPDPSSPGGSV